MPVGKAIALAAMPSAALLGMGFTSPLAKADQQPESPFLGDSCVEVPDAELEEEVPDAELEEEAPAGEREAPEEPEESEEPEEPEEPEESERPEAPEESERAPEGETEDPRQEGGRTEEEPEDQDAAPEAASPTEPEGDDAGAPDAEGAEEGLDPRDPLGLGQGLEDLGDGLGDLLDPRGDDADEQQPEEPEAPPQAPEEPDAPEAPAEPEEPEGGAGDEAPEEQDPEDEGEDDGQDEAGAGDGGRGSEEEREAADADPAAPEEDGRVPLPCPIQGLVEGTDERTPLPLPNAAWYLEATSLTLHGLSYEGVVNVTTPNGTVKQALKFTADALDIGDLHQIVDAGSGARHHVATDPGTVSTFRGGTVTMYTERLEGNLFGLIPTVYDPENQPPLDLPFAHFTDVSVTQAGQFGGTLTMQGMHIYTTDDGPTVP
ncbi:hypothetical protein [Streptomyces sp. SBT349]|uniref:hypothetical protein n=1 Tax=Streptomyces sp. SBT349 TaxID=1580539 RepID=UPI00066B6716|nr:hypothetical protein [Streptomyces sp. SBT349]